ncbi:MULTISPECIES: xanthine dehydrogenase family protein subunit M [unclassified Chelatococcus]|uniref:FAD binding domain-containing protein n=1 Tax=unclassified Chelatococcus TaxID=2638111 RepID=UPI001BD1065B|nr:MULTISPECIES: xanthine dehydrogenase family protein subunit M [unclassified Chelatococcus]CAH1650996.1 6-hydroxypseudooxynicotine dehydrogenase complex subunit alpha [Hyphomicrobiales bacterium]MBS7743231.1 xanthine dehydrogenase family protein subunit M [Chelatococcus sp. HY11]MBX3541651.1 xanthine dehydrogenase family protein subunit M [Chelatococcus sp.]MCO5074457.1 xanthine dehydrogenase family protein subunit M [Chelatococcus sp.]CAH1692976.1 6-hydroxypseudooxynicotine dehydrogenase co
MKPASFDYIRPGSRAEIVAALAEHGDDGKILAGGQSLVAAMNFRLARPEVLIDINGTRELDYLKPSGDTLAIGALTRHAAFHKPAVPGPLGVLLAKVVRHIAHYPIRQRGTFTGSLAHADPASEWCLVATTLDAEMLIVNAAGERRCRAGDFFKGTFTTAVGAQDLLSEVRLPLLGDGWRSGFYEFARRAGDFALAMSLVALKLENGRITAARLGVGGVADRAIRLRDLENELVDKAPSRQLFEDVAASARAAIKPSEDIHASADYRSDLIRTVVLRALTEAAA